LSGRPAGAGEQQKQQNHRVCSMPGQVVFSGFHFHRHTKKMTKIWVFTAIFLPKPKPLDTDAISELLRPRPLISDVENIYCLTIYIRYTIFLKNAYSPGKGIENV